ncbi:MAG: flippase-like domain-containing protein [Firmicutes bacterium]|nr:flippase-like domain-containing protein [Bacillota bacterium]
MNFFGKFIRKNWFGMISIGISLTMLTVYLTAAGGVGALAASVAGMDKRWLAGMIACTLAFWFTDGMVLHVYIRMKYKRHRYFQSLKTTMIGLLYNNLTPFASGGQPMQVYDLARDGIDAGDAASFVAVKTILYQTCLTVYAVAVLASTFSFFRAHIPRFGLLLWAGIGVNTVFVAALGAVAVNKSAARKLARAAVGFLSALRIIKKRERALESLNKQITLFNESFALIYQKKDRLILGFALTVLQQTLYYCLPFCIYKSFSLSGSAFTLLLGAQAILSLIMAFVPLPGGSGVAESGFYLFFALFFAQSVIMPAVFIWRFLTYYSTIIVGGAVSFIDSRRSGKKADAGRKRKETAK